MLLRSTLVVAIIASLAVCGLNVIKVKEKVLSLRSDLKQQTSTREAAETDLATAKSEQRKTTVVLKQTRTELEAVTVAKEKATAEIASQNGRIVKLIESLVESRQEREDALAHLARYQASGIEPEQIANAAHQIKDLQEALTLANAQNKTLQAKIPDEGCIVRMPPGLTGKVLISDPKWHFVVLDAGDDQGVLEHGELLVNRNGKLVAKLKVSRVEKDRCVANIIPGWALAEVIEGDQVVPAYPRS